MGAWGFNGLVPEQARPRRATSSASAGTAAGDLRVDPALARQVDDAVVDLTVVEPHRARHVLGHDPSDFSWFYQRYRVMLERRATRFLSDPRDVDEVVQETFLRVFLALEELETEVAAVRFAQRVLVNMCIDRYRLQARRPGMLDLESFAHELVGVEDDPVLRAEDAAVVREALSRLSPEHRAALIKREIEEKSLPDIAAEMSVPVDQVKHLLYRARRALRRILIGTSVDPAVDLTAVEAGEPPRRRRAVATAVTARALGAVLLLIAGVGWAAGVRPWSGGSGQSASTVGANGPDRIPLTLAHPVPPKGSEHRSRPAAKAPHRGAPTGHLPAVGAQHVPATTASRGAGAPAGHPTRHPGSATRSAPAAPPTVHQPSAPTQPSVGRHNVSPGTGSGDPMYTVTGLLHSTAAQVTTQTRVVTAPHQYQSTATFVAATEQGTFSMDQTLSFAKTGSTVHVADAQLAPVVPSSSTGETYGYMTTAPSVAVQPTSSGYLVTVSGSAQPWSSPASTPIGVTVTAAYTRDLTGVTAETVTLTSAANPKPSASPTAPVTGSSGVVLSGDTRRPKGSTRDESSVS